MKKIITLFVICSISVIGHSQDSDSDGLSDFDEINGTNGYTSDPNMSDTDSDGLNDYDEVMGANNPQGYVSNPNLTDSDSDGLTDLDEVFASFTFYSDPLLSDTDNDGLTDYEESTSNNPSGYYSNPNLVDSDSDGLTDFEEVMGVNANNYTSDPLDVDTDNGSVNDGDEISAGLNPNVSSDDGCFNDTDGPVPDITNLPDVNGNCKVTSLTAPTATDACNFTIVTGTHNAVLPITQEGTIVVTWTYEDALGNKTTQVQNVTVNTIPVTETVSFVDDVTLIADLPADSYVWIDCATLLPVPGATSQQFTATENGSYAVYAIYGSCSDTSDCETISKVSLDENYLNDKLSIYPNPSSDGKFKINYEGVINRIRLYNMIGKEINLQSYEYDKLIDLSSLNTGKYIIQIEVPEGIITKKIILLE